jgi:type IV pilus assembly protein PilA
VLAAIAIPTFLAQRTRAANAAAESDLRNAAAAAQSCASANRGGVYDTPNNCHSITLLDTDFGFNPTDGVTVTPTGSGADVWSATSVSADGDTTYEFNSSVGRVEEAGA